MKTYHTEHVVVIADGHNRFFVCSAWAQANPRTCMPSFIQFALMLDLGISVFKLLKRMTRFSTLAIDILYMSPFLNPAAAAAIFSKSQDRTCCGEAKTTSIAAAWRSARAWILNLGFRRF